MNDIEDELFDIAVSKSVGGRLCMLPMRYDISSFDCSYWEEKRRGTRSSSSFCNRRARDATGVLALLQLVL